MVYWRRMKLLLLFVGGLLVIGGGYWWSLRPAEPLAFENERSLTLEPVEEQRETAREDEPIKEGDKPVGATLTEISTTMVPAPLPETTPQTGLEIIPRLTSFGFRTPPSKRSIDTIVLHSSYNASGGDVYNLEKIIGQYEQYGVGAHYLIARDGKIYQLVRESDIAYHAGESKMPDGRKNVNDFSIGVELVGTEESGFTNKQYDAVNDLIVDIKTRYKIKDIVGHGDVAPKRKTDPWKFDWKKLR